MGDTGSGELEVVGGALRHKVRIQVGAAFVGENGARSRRIG